MGQEDSATEMFSMREAGSGIEISSSLSGSIQDHNIMGFSTLYVLWSAASEYEVQYLEGILNILDGNVIERVRHNQYRLL